MIEIINPSYKLENVLFNTVLEAYIKIKAPQFKMVCKGNLLNENLLGMVLLEKKIEIEPSLERLAILNFDCLISNESSGSKDYELEITFKQGSVICGNIHKMGKLNSLQEIHLQHLIWFPFD